jgi:hypothetical protein
MKILKFILPLLVFFILSCNADTEIETDDLIQKVFSESEIEDLNSIEEFFKNQIKRTVNCDENDCFDQFMKESISAAETGLLPIEISNQEIKDLFSEFQSNLFDEIWRIQYYTDELGTKHESIGLEVFEKKYGEFLILLSKNDLAIKEYYNHLKSAGNIDSGAQGMLIISPEKFKTNDYKIRLVIAIHYITICY